MPRPQISCILGHAHNTKDCTKCMSQGSLAALIDLDEQHTESKVADLVRNLQQVSPTDS